MKLEMDQQPFYYDTLAYAAKTRGLDYGKDYSTTGECFTQLEKKTKYTGQGVDCVVLVGPPGVGKSTILKEVLQHNNIKFLKPLSTRQQQQDEESLDRIFISPQTFQDLKDKNDLLTIRNVIGGQGSYHTAISKGAIHQFVTDPKPGIIEKTFAGWLELMQAGSNDAELQSVLAKLSASYHFAFILPPDFLTLARRNWHRPRSANFDIVTHEEKKRELNRMKGFDKLLVNSVDFPNVSFIVNDDVVKASEEMLKMLKKHTPQ